MEQTEVTDSSCSTLSGCEMQHSKRKRDSSQGHCLTERDCERLKMKSYILKKVSI